MVFVSIGTQKQQFSRLFNIIEKSEILKDKDIVAQVGFTYYDKSNIKTVKFVDEEKLKEYIKQSEYVICHGGVGTIFTALSCGKKVLVVPRLKKYKEHKNDHQLEICRELEREGYILYLNENEDIDTKLKLFKKIDFKQYVKDEKYLEILKNNI